MQLMTINVFHRQIQSANWPLVKDNCSLEVCKLIVILSQLILFNCKIKDINSVKPGQINQRKECAVIISEERPKLIKENKKNY
jgi:hypothetical protein